MIILFVVFLFLGFQHAVAQEDVGNTAGESCITIKLTSPHTCNSLKQITLPNNLSKWFRKFNLSTAPSVNSSEDINSMLNIVTSNLSSWEQIQFDCSLTQVKYRWFKTFACYDLAEFGSSECKTVLPASQKMCPKEAEEFAKSLEFSAEHRENKCTPDSIKKVKAFAMKFKGISEIEKGDCFNGHDVESNNFCGFPTNTSACLFGCEGGTFSKTLSTNCASVAKNTDDTLTPLEHFDSEKYSSAGGIWKKILTPLYLGIAGGVLILIIILIIACCLYRRRRRKLIAGVDKFDKYESKFDSTYSKRDTFISRPKSDIPPQTIEQTRGVVRSYTPCAEDELKLSIGQQIYVHQLYNDKYAYGKDNHGNFGFFPAMCVGLEDEIQEVRETVVNPNIQRFTVASMKSEYTMR